MNKLQLSCAALFIGAAMCSMTPAIAADAPVDATAPIASMKCVDKNNNDVMKEGKVIMDDSEANKEACTKAEGHWTDVAAMPADAGTQTPAE